MSVSVFGEKDIEDMGVESVLDLANFVPNLMIFANGVSGTNSPSMRGIHAFVESLTVSNGLFVDGIPILSPIGLEDGLLDIERVEVLRGPQGTLYGRNTETGVINIITKKPGNDFQGKASAELGTDQKRQLTLNLSGPIKKDRLFFGVSGKFYEKEGFIDNTFLDEPANDKKHWYGKLHLRWVPVDALDISLISSALKYDEGANVMGLGAAGAAAYGLPAPIDGKVASDYPGKNTSKSVSNALNISYDFGNSLKLTSITTRRVYNDEGRWDYDFNPVKFMHTTKTNEYTSYSQELRLNSSGDRLKWLVGLYYDNHHNDVNTTLNSVIPSMVSTNDRDFDGDSMAFFGQASYPILTRLTLVAGLRYEKQDKEFEDHILVRKADNSWDDFAPKLALEYSFTPDVMAYASVSKGYRSGGFNTYATDPQYTKYDEEKLWSYEIGLKSELLDKRLILNASVFYMNIEDMQVNESVTPYEAFLTNAGKASATGGELEMRAQLFQGLSLIANFGYCDIKFDEFKDALGDYQGNRNPYAPDYNYNLGAQYRASCGIFARVDLIGYGKMYFDKTNTYSREAFEIVNAKIGYEMENFDIYLYGKNVFDQEYNSYGYFDGFYTLYSEPAEFGLRLTYRF
ncbi:TonB-dependent receptor [Dethiosulfatarculus sandiegensis]|nr:TonB-dependent receptor [Dethiosulfatarculus sandiegensis]